MTRDGGSAARIRRLPMKLRVVALGHRMPAWVAAGWDDYAQAPAARIRARARSSSSPSRAIAARPFARLLAAEAARIVAACRRRACVALDERGAAWTTRELADHLARWREDAAMTSRS